MGQDLILITSAAGQTGTRLIRHLTARGARVRGLVTRQASADKVRALGAEPVFGSLDDAASLARAMQGVDTVYHIAPTLATDEHAMGRRVIDAARQAGVGYFVLHGVIAPYLDNINYHHAKQLIQLDLYRSGMAYCVLLPTNFMQNVNWTWPAIMEKGVWELPYDVDKPLTWVDLEDVAEAAAVVLTDRGHAYATYELCGNQAFLSRAQIAGMMSRVLGREVEAREVAVDEYLEQYRRMPFFERKSGEELAQIRAMFIDYDRHGMPAGNGHVLSMLLGRPAGTYEQFLARLARAPTAGAAGTAPLVTSYGLPGG